MQRTLITTQRPSHGPLRSPLHRKMHHALPTTDITPRGLKLGRLDDAKTGERVSRRTYYGWLVRDRFSTRDAWDRPELKSPPVKIVDLIPVSGPHFPGPLSPLMRRQLESWGRGHWCVNEMSSDALFSRSHIQDTCCQSVKREGRGGRKKTPCAVLGRRWGRK